MNRKYLSSFSLKIIAIISMTVDHVGYVLLPQYFFLRGIGRLAFPIYCFLLSEGYHYSRSRRMYLIRLSVFALLSEVPFDLAFHRTWLEFSSQNVFFTLVLAFCAIWCFESVKSVFSGNYLIAVLSVLPFCVAAELVKSDYGMWGILFVASFWILRDRPVLALTAFAFFNTILSLFDSHIIQLAALGAIPILFLYNDRNGKRSLKYVFYAYYPLHLTVIHLLALWKRGQLF